MSLPYPRRSIVGWRLLVGGICRARLRRLPKSCPRSPDGAVFPNIQRGCLWRSTMSQAPSVAFAGVTGVTGDAEVHDGGGEPPAQVTLRGTTRGLEILIVGTPSAAALGARLSELLAEAPGF